LFGQPPCLFSQVTLITCSAKLLFEPCAYSLRRCALALRFLLTPSGGQKLQFSCPQPLLRGLARRLSQKKLLSNLFQLLFGICLRLSCCTALFLCFVSRAADLLLSPLFALLSLERLPLSQLLQLSAPALSLFIKRPPQLAISFLPFRFPLLHQFRLHMGDTVKLVLAFESAWVRCRYARR